MSTSLFISSSVFWAIVLAVLLSIAVDCYTDLVILKKNLVIGALEYSAAIAGIVLQWSMTLTKSHARIATYQIFGYKERPGPITGLEWKKVIACYLSHYELLVVFVLCFTLSKSYVIRHGNHVCSCIFKTIKINFSIHAVNDI